MIQRGHMASTVNSTENLTGKGGELLSRNDYGPTMGETQSPGEAPAYKAGRLPAVPGLDLLGLVEQVVGEVLLAHVAHGVQVLKEPLGKERERTQRVKSPFQESGGPLQDFH